MQSLQRVIVHALIIMGNVDQIMEFDFNFCTHPEYA